VSDEFKDFFLDYFNKLPNFDASKLQAIDWNAWFYEAVRRPLLHWSPRLLSHV
jgi:hypothetical protein